MWFYICVGSYIYNEFIIIFMKCEQLYSIRDSNKIMCVYLNSILIQFNLIFDPYGKKGVHNNFINKLYYKNLHKNQLYISV